MSSSRILRYGVRHCVLSRFDYCNAVLVGLPASQLNRLRSVLHATAKPRDSSAKITWLAVCPRTHEV